MINTNRYQGPASINGHRMWCGTCKRFQIYFDTRAGQWDWPYRCAYCDLGVRVPPEGYPKRLRAAEIVLGILGWPVVCALRCMSKIQDWLGDRIG